MKQRWRVIDSGLALGHCAGFFLNKTGYMVNLRVEIFENGRCREKPDFPHRLLIENQGVYLDHLNTQKKPPKKFKIMLLLNFETLSLVNSVLLLGFN